MADEGEFVVPDWVGRVVRCGKSTVCSNFATKILHTLALGWGELEREMVRWMGLGGLLYLDKFTHWNRDFSVFVYQCIDTRRCRMVVGKEKYAEINEQEIVRICGIREGGAIELVRTRGAPETGELQAVCNILLLPLQCITLEVLVEVLKEERRGVLSLTEERRFKAAYAMVVYTEFFSPREKKGPMPRDAYLLAMRVADLDKINWGKLAVEEILYGAAKIQRVGRRPGSKQGTLYGPQMPVQILYFDSVDTGYFAVSPNLVPRVAHYTVARLGALIRRDMFKLDNEKIYGIFRRVVTKQAYIRQPKQVHHPAHVRTRQSVPTRRRTSVPSIVQYMSSAAAGRQEVVAPSTSSVMATPVVLESQSAPPVQAAVPPAVQVTSTNVEPIGVSSSSSTPATPIVPDQSLHNERVQQIVDGAGVWLKEGLLHVEEQSDRRSSEFYGNVSYSMRVFDENAKASAVAHENIERTNRLQALLYMCQHLVSRGLGPHMPYLEGHIADIKTLLGENACPNPADPTGVLNFMRICSLGDLPFLPRGVQSNEPTVTGVVDTLGNGMSGEAVCVNNIIPNYFATIPVVAHTVFPERGVPFMPRNGSGSGGQTFSDENRFINEPFRAVPIRDGTGRMYQDLFASGALQTPLCPVLPPNTSLTMGGAFRRPTVSGVEETDASLILCSLRAAGGMLNQATQSTATDQSAASVSEPDGGDSECFSRASMDLNLLPPEESQTSVGGLRKRQFETSDAVANDREVIVYTGKRARKSYVLCSRKKVTNFVPGFCPLAYGFDFGLPTSVAARENYEKIDFLSNEDLNKFWVVHTDPKLLKIKGCELVDSFDKGGSIQGKGFDGVCRMLRGVERSWYSTTEKSRFRNVMPVEWACAILSGGEYTLDEKIKDMFTGVCIDYDIETCHMIWAPLEDEDGYSVLYGFDMNLDIVHVMDPKRTNAGGTVLQNIHEGVCSRLLDGLIACIGAFFDGWEVKKDSWSFLYHKYQNTPCTDADTFVYTVHNIMFYDGLVMTQPLLMEDLVDFKLKLLHMVVNMPGNIGHPPLMLRENVE